MILNFITTAEILFPIKITVLGVLGLGRINLPDTSQLTTSL